MKEEQNQGAQEGEDLSELDGANLEWLWFAVSHSRFCLLASGLVRGYAAFYFHFVTFVDCPTRMHDVRIRTATDSELEDFRSLLPPDEKDLLKPEDLIIIKCREGVYSIWAMGSGFDWIETPDDAYMYERSSNYLWPGGPSLDSL